MIISNTTASMIGKSGVAVASEFGWQGIFVKFLNYIIFQICKKMSNKSHSKMNTGLFCIYMIVPVSTLGTMLMVFYSGVDYNGKTVLRIILTMFFVFMVVGNIVLFYAFQNHIEKMNEITRKEFELSVKNAEIERLTKITELNDEYNETVHNMTHLLKTIEELARENKVADIIQSVEDMTGRLVKRNTYEFSSCKMLNTILSEYKDKADDNSIDFDVYVEPGCVINQMSEMDLVCVVGNLLGNAFEAASKLTVKMEKPVVIFRLFMHEKGKMCILKVVNDYDGKLIERNGVLQTTKTESGIHGIGVASVNRTVEKYKGLFCYYTEKGRFVAAAILPVKAKE